MVPPASWRAPAGHRIASPSFAWLWRPMGDTLAGVVLLELAGCAGMCVDSGIYPVPEKGGTQGGFLMRTSMSRELTVTDKQARLVDTLVATGCTIKDAALEAGYASGDSGRVTASKALRLPHVQAYMMQRVGEALGLNATTAAARLVQLAKGAKSEYVQLEASKDILDRAGFKAPDKHMHLHAGDISVSIDLS